MSENLEPQESFAVGDERDLGAVIPSSLDDFGLDPYEFRIYARLARRANNGGAAYESVSRMAKACRIGDQKVKEVLRFLLAAGMVSKHSRQGQTTVYRLKANQHWTHPEMLDELRRKTSYHPGARNTQVSATPRCQQHPGKQKRREVGVEDTQGVGVEDTQGVGVEDTQGVGVEDTHKGIPIKESNEGIPLRNPDQECGAIAIANAPRPHISTAEIDQSQSGQAVTDPLSESGARQNTTVKARQAAQGKGSEPKNSKERKKRLEDMTAAQVYGLLPDRDRYERHWVWYCNQCAKATDSKGKTPNPGDKKLAAIAWIEMEIDSIYDEYREGCRVFNWKGVGIPHFSVFLRGNKTDGKEPYWRAALEQHKARQQQTDPDLVEAIEQTSEPWGSYQNPDPGFLDYLLRICLPKLPCNKGVTLNKGDAHKWLNRARVEPLRLDAALIEWSSYQDWLKRREGASSAAAIENQPKPLSEADTDTRLSTLNEWLRNGRRESVKQAIATNPQWGLVLSNGGTEVTCKMTA
jgi:hypothetical protein